MSRAIPNALLVYPKPPPHLLGQQLYLGIMGIRRHLTPEQLPVFSRYIARSSRDHPRWLPLAIRLAAMGYHCEKLTRQQTVLREFKSYLKSELASFNEAGRGSDAAAGMAESFRQEALQRSEARQRAIPEEFRHAGDGISESLAAFRLALSTEGQQALPDNGNLPLAGGKVDLPEAARS